MNNRKLGFGLLGFLLVLFSSCANQNKVGLNDQMPFFDSWKGKALVIPPNYTEREVASNVTNSHVTVHYRQKINKVSDFVNGVNITTYTGNYLKDSALMRHLSSLEPGLIRFPGGDASNMYFFNGLPNDLPAKALTFDREWNDFLDGTDSVDWRMNTARYYDLLDSTKSEGLITVNYAYARYGTGNNPVAQAAKLAADWVRFDNGRTKFWEVGNETYACWEGGFRIDKSKNKDHQPEYIDGRLYGQHFKIFADSMRAAAKEIGVPIYVGAVFADDDDVWDGSGRSITRNWNQLLAQQLRHGDDKNYADFISIHSYFLNHDEKTPAEIIHTSRTVPIQIQTEIYRKLDDAEVMRVPLVLSEWNVKEPFQTTHVAGMQAVSTLCHLHQVGFGASCYFSIKDYWRGNQGDFGMFSHRDPVLFDSEPYPAFYHFFYLSKILGDQIVEVDCSNDSLLCYASSYEYGGIGMVIINMSQQNCLFSVEAEDFDFGSYCYWYELSKPETHKWNSEKVVVNGAFNRYFPKGGPSSHYSRIPAWRGEIDQGLSLSIGGLSAIYLIIEGEDSDK